MVMLYYISFFFKENVRYLVWTSRDLTSLILGTRFSILGTRIGSLKHLKKTVLYPNMLVHCIKSSIMFVTKLYDVVSLSNKFMSTIWNY